MVKNFYEHVRWRCAALIALSSMQLTTNELLLMQFASIRLPASVQLIAALFWQIVVETMRWHHHWLLQEEIITIGFGGLVLVANESIN